MEGIERVIDAVEKETGFRVSPERAEAIVRENHCATVDEYFAAMQRFSDDREREGVREGSPEGKFADSASVGFAPKV